MGWFLHDLAGIFDPLDWFNKSYWQGPTSLKQSLEQDQIKKIGKKLYNNPEALAKLTGQINNYNYKVSNALTRLDNIKDNWINMAQGEEQNLDPNVYTSSTAATYYQYKKNYNKLLNAASSAYHGDLSKLNKLMSKQSLYSHALNTYENNRNEHSSTGDSLLGVAANAAMLMK